MFIVKYKSIFIGLSLALAIISIVAISKFGIKKGIDFTGGTIIETSYVGLAPTSTVELSQFKTLQIEAFQTGTSSYKFISSLSYEDMSSKIKPILTEGDQYQYKEDSIVSVGPTMGSEMTKKAIIAIVIVVFAILLFIAFAFREVSKPVSSWKYGTIAMVTLVHDILLPTGIYVWLSYARGAQIDTLFVIALLTILAISISDKIVVFDRIRENLRLNLKKDFGEVVGISLRQTFTRSINTSVTVVLALVALYWFGPVTTKFFAFTLMMGMIVGTYSSIFVASPLLVVWNNRHLKNKK